MAPERLPAALVLGSPCLAVAVSLSILVACRYMDLPNGSYITDPAAAVNAALAFIGSAIGGLLTRGSTAGRVMRTAGAGLFGAVAYGVVILGLDKFTELI